MLKKIIFTSLLLVTSFFVLNFDFFWKNIKYQFKIDDYRQALAPQEKMEQDLLLVPSLDIDVPVLYAERVDEDHFQELLINGVVHYPGTAEIGKPGNAYIFGHSSDNAWSPGKYKTVFALLPRVEVGSLVYVSDHEGNKYTYKVIEGRVVEKNDLTVLEQDYSKKLLTLQTSYPVGTALRRYIIVAELVEYSD